MSQTTVDSFDREYIESDYEDSQNTCEGCYLLNRGMGGENQLAHMNPGGCLYDYSDFSDHSEYSDNSDRSINYPIQVNQQLVCVICSNESIIKKNEAKTFVCDTCNDTADKKREIKYQTFMFNGYK